MDMDISGELSYPLSVLVRAIGFKNLSAASQHVGLSQPQLSRIIAKLEQDVGLSLLDRQVKRKACWTPEALRLAEMYQGHQRRLDAGIKALQVEGKIRQLHLGTLEGLAPVALRLAEILFKIPPMETVFVDVFDRGDLEAKFMSGDLDLILNSRMTGKAKPKFVHTLGYQTLDTVDKGGDFSVFSSFEFGQLRKKPKGGTLVSNSLFVRKQWFEKNGGHGWLPSDIADKPKKGGEEVLLLGGDWIEQKLWDTLINKF